jgi:putative acetyltransferase
VTLASVFHVRPAMDADAEHIARVRYSAIQQIAASAYPRDTINAWSGPLNEEKVRQFRQVIAGGQELLHVAEHQSRIVGFGSIIPARNELRAIYVDAEWVRKGVGGAILHHLEGSALHSKCPHLQLEASVNAKEFYLAHGYVELQTATHGFGDNYTMACIVMRKSFARAR